MNFRIACWESWKDFRRISLPQENSQKIWELQASRPKCMVMMLSRFQNSEFRHCSVQMIVYPSDHIGFENLEQILFRLFAKNTPRIFFLVFIPWKER